MAHRRRRRRRRNYRGEFIAVLIALAVTVIAIVCIMRFPKTKAAQYPVLYTEEIRACAAENSIPAPYIAAVIMAESSYNPNAVSAADARGLMQIMSNTGYWISGKLDDEYSDERMFIPEVNIRYGSWYLGFLMARYDGDMRCATAAYHAGQGTVDKWLKDPSVSSDGKNLDVIPYSSTSTYVDRVLGYYEYYEKAYGDIR